LPQELLLIGETAITSAEACFELYKDICERKKGICQGVIKAPIFLSLFFFSLLFLSFNQF
jgi:hypothetical protein